MQVTIRLFSTLRELLPPEAKGRAMMDFPSGARLGDLRARLGLPRVVAFAVNGQAERDETRALAEGDEVSVFRPAGGGDE